MGIYSGLPPASFYYSRRSVPAAPKGRGEHRCSRSVQKRDLGAPTGTARSGREPHHYVAASPQAGSSSGIGGLIQSTSPVSSAPAEVTASGMTATRSDPSLRSGRPMFHWAARRAVDTPRSAPAPRGCWPRTRSPDRVVSFLWFIGRFHTSLSEAAITTILGDFLDVAAVQWNSQLGVCGNPV